MDIEQVLPHVLECVDTARLGPRKVALLELVYIRQAGQRCYVPMGAEELARYGRSPSQAGYDRRALAELVELGMLRRLQGRGQAAHAYSLREPRLWSPRIRWLGERNRIISFFWRLQPRDAIDLSRVDAGQELFLRATGRPKPGSLPRAVSVEHRAAREFHRAAKSGPAVGTGAGHRAANPAGGAPVTQLPLSSKEDVDLDLEEEERRLREEAEQLGRAVARRIGRDRLWGRALDPLRELVARYPDHTEDLYTLAVTVPADILSPVEAAATFAAIADAAAAAGWPHPNADKIAALKRRIAVLEDFAPDDQQLPQLHAELRGLESAIAS